MSEAQEILCNLCGLSCTLGAGSPCVDHKGGLHAEVVGGYESTPGNGHGALDDVTSYRFALCEFCLDWLFSQFVIEVSVVDLSADIDAAKQVWRSAADRVAADDWRKFKDEFRAEAQRRAKHRWKVQERLQYCILIDENGNKSYVRWADVVFPMPTQRFHEDGKGNRKFRPIELNGPIQGGFLPTDVFEPCSCSESREVAMPSEPMTKETREGGVEAGDLIGRRLLVVQSVLNSAKVGSVDQHEADRVRQLIVERDSAAAELGEARVVFGKFGPKPGELSTFIRETLRVDMENIAHLNKRIAELEAARKGLWASADRMRAYIAKATGHSPKDQSGLEAEVFSLCSQMGELVRADHHHLCRDLACPGRPNCGRLPGNYVAPHVSVPSEHLCWCGKPSKDPKRPDWCGKCEPLEDHEVAQLMQQHRRVSK